MHPTLTNELTRARADDVRREFTAARGARDVPVPMRMHAVTAADRAHVEAAFRRLSQATIVARFLGFVKPTPRLFDWVDELDGSDRAAVAAVHGSSGAPLGVARWVRSRSDPTRAEVAITVADRWQHRGVGEALARELARRARRVGITTLTATAFADNRAARALARTLGEAHAGRPSGGVLCYDVRL